MKFAAAYLLCVLGGKDPTKENLEALLGSVGIDWEKRGDDLLLTKVTSLFVRDASGA